MAKYTLQPGETRRVSASSRYLSVIELDGKMTIASPSYNLKEFRVKPGWQLDLNGIPEVDISNIDSAPITAEIQDAGIRIQGGGGGAVSVTNAPSIQRIIEPLDFNANVTFDGGSVELISPDTLETLPDKVCPASSSVMLADAAPARTTLIIQNRSDEYELRIGGNTVSGSAGFVLEPGATTSLSTKAPVFAFNAAGVDVTVTLTEL